MPDRIAYLPDATNTGPRPGVAPLIRGVMIRGPQRAARRRAWLAEQWHWLWFWAGVLYGGGVTAGIVDLVLR
jgi:hypothetical protein